MTPKEKRDQLFGKQRPRFRPLELLTSKQGDYSRDVKLMWVAYSREPFYWFPKNLDQTGFARTVETMIANKEVLIAEDYHREYSGFGPIAFVTMDTDGWKVEPHTFFFPWVSARNKLRATVAFFQWIRYQSVGACVVHSLQNSKSLFDRCVDYGVLHYVGRIVNGDPRGDDFIYSVRGKKCPDHPPVI